MALDVSVLDVPRTRLSPLETDADRRVDRQLYAIIYHLQIYCKSTAVADNLAVEIADANSSVT